MTYHVHQILLPVMAGTPQTLPEYRRDTLAISLYTLLHSVLLQLSRFCQTAVEHPFILQTALTDSTHFGVGMVHYPCLYLVLDVVEVYIIVPGTGPLKEDTQTAYPVPV